MITVAQIETFVSQVQEKVSALHAKSGCNWEVKIEVEFGKKYARIIKSDFGSRSAYCFVDMATGDILKAAGWKAPAKGIRGNIRNGAADVTQYGAVYLR